MHMSYETLDAYRAAVEFNKLVQPLIVKIAIHSESHAGQLLRAADSLEDTTAEGGTATTPGKKANYFRIGRDSGGECRAQLKRAARKGWITDSECVEATIALNKAMFLLQRLIDKWERKAAIMRGNKPAKTQARAHKKHRDPG